MSTVQTVPKTPGAPKVQPLKRVGMAGTAVGMAGTAYAPGVGARSL